MKDKILPAILLVGFYFCSAAEVYPTIWDDINIDEILKNTILFNNYAKCLQGEGKCSNEGAMLKNFLPEALKTNCTKCSEKQKDGAAKVVKFMSESRPDVWKALIRIYDPKGEYMEKYADDLKRIGAKPLDM